MEGLQTECCVEIRVPLRNGKKGFGTGYFAGPHWVLTAYHVLFDDEVDYEKLIEITWWDKKREKVGERKSLQFLDVKWFNAQYDLALIHCGSVECQGGDAFRLIDRKRPDKWAEWKAGGYLAKLDDSPKMKRRVTPSGKLGAFNSEEYNVSLSVNQEDQEDIADWEGFSGSPIFVNDYLVGIARWAKNKKTLTASLISEALDAEGDQKQGLLRDIPDFLTPPANICRERLQPIIEDLLRTGKQVYKALIEEYRNKSGKKITSEGQLATALLGMGEDDITECLHQVFSNIMAKNKEPNAIRVMKELACIWSAILAADRCSVLDIKAFKNNAGIDPYRVEVVEPVGMGVEAQAANGEAREPKLVLKNGLLWSPFDLTSNHRTGCVEPDVQAERDIKESCSRKMIPGLTAFSVDDVKNELELFLTTKEEIGITEASLPEDYEERGKMIGRYLKRGLPGLIGSYYMRFYESGDEQQDPVLREIRKWCPQLVLFQVSLLHDPDRVFNQTNLHQIIHSALSYAETQKNS